MVVDANGSRRRSGARRSSTPRSPCSPSTGSTAPRPRRSPGGPASRSRTSSGSSARRRSSSSPSSRAASARRSRSSSGRPRASGARRRCRRSARPTASCSTSDRVYLRAQMQAYAACDDPDDLRGRPPRLRRPRHATSSASRAPTRRTISRVLREAGC